MLGISVEASAPPDPSAPLYAQLTRGDDRVEIPLQFTPPIAPDRFGTASGRMPLGMDLGRWNTELMWGDDRYGVGILEIQPPESARLQLAKLDPESTYDLVTAYIPDPKEKGSTKRVHVANDLLRLKFEELPNLRIHWGAEVYRALESDCSARSSLGSEHDPVAPPVRFYACRTKDAETTEVQVVPSEATFELMDTQTQVALISSTPLPDMFLTDMSKITKSEKLETVNVALHGTGFQVVNPNDNSIWIDGVRQSDIVWDSCSVNLGTRNAPRPSAIHGQVVSAEEIRLCSIPAPRSGSMQLTVGYGDQQSQPQVFRVFNMGRTGVTIWSVLIALALALLPLLLLSSLQRSYRIADSDYKWRMLFLDPETDTYSLSKLQFYLWTVAALFGYAYLFISRVKVQFAPWPDVPSSLPGIILVAGGTAVTSQIITSMKGSKGAGEEKPNFADFITSGGVVAADRLQMLLWTLGGLGAFFYAVMQQLPGTITDLPAIPDRLLVLMGISSAGYLGGKIARKAGPVISEISITPAESDAALALKQDLGETPDLVGPLSRAQEVLARLAADSKNPNTQKARTALDQAMRSASAAHTSTDFSQLVTALGGKCTDAESAAAAAATDFAAGRATADDAQDAQTAAAALEDFTADVLQAISLASMGPMKTEETHSMTIRIIELRGTNLSAEALFQIDNADLSFRMLTDKDGKNEPEIVQRDQTNPTLASLLRLTIDPMRLGDSDQTLFAAWFSADGRHVFTIINPDGQKSELSFSIPPATTQKVSSHG